MGFIKAFTGALGGTFADQWKDFYAPEPDVPGTAAIFQAVPYGQNNGRGENTKGNKNVITNGSNILVPEGTALKTVQLPDSLQNREVLYITQTIRILSRFSQAKKTVHLF